MIYVIGSPIEPLLPPAGTRSQFNEAEGFSSRAFGCKTFIPRTDVVRSILYIADLKSDATKYLLKTKN